MASRTVAGSFERPVEMSDQETSAPGIALGGSGAALVSWSVRLPGGSRVLQAAGRPAAAPRWGAADDVGIGSEPVVAVNDVGDAVVAWGRGEPGREQTVEASTRRGGGLWRASTDHGVPGLRVRAARVRGGGGRHRSRGRLLAAR